MIQNKTLGEKISNLRNASNLTQEQLAEKSKLHRTTISDIERNVVSPNIDNLNNIANALNVELYELLTSPSQRKTEKLHQPYNGMLGVHLQEQLENSKYKRVYISAAYAKLSGVARLKDSLSKFKANGGTIVCIIGIDQRNTTYEALEQLYSISDQLIVVHNNSFSHTFHPKIYMFDQNSDDTNKVWLAIGSNNFTAGGLFINYESCSIDNLYINNANDKKNYNDTLDVFNRYLDSNNKITLEIRSTSDLDDLLNAKYILKERQTKINSIKSYSSKQSTSLFGRETYSIPSNFNTSTVPTNTTSETHNSDTSNTTTDSADTIQTTNSDSTAIITTDSFSSMEDLNKILSESSDGERVWFEMRKSTGGSRNILDLSSTGKLRSGSGINTNYYIDDATVKGGVCFFDINPDTHDTIKNITITYNNNDYYPSTILYATNNQSWRLQLKGESPTDKFALSQYGKLAFVNRILIFTKLTTDHYLLETIDEKYLPLIKQCSKFYATNGTPEASKSYGFLE